MNDLLIECMNAAMETLNFTLAAQKLCISQPSFSRNIATLEYELGFPLFYRSKQNGLSPTLAGTLFYSGVQDVARRYSSVLQQCREISRGESGKLVIGVLSGARIKECVRERIQQFCDAYPGVEVELMGCSLDMQERCILQGEFDVCLMMADILREPERLSSQALCPMESHLAVPSALGLDTSRRYDLLDLRDQTFILVDRFNIIQDDFRQTCRTAGFEPRIKLAPSFETAMLWVSMGIGVSGIVPDHYTGGVSHVDFIPLSGGKSMNYSVVWKRDTANPVVAQFCAFMKSAFA